MKRVLIALIALSAVVFVGVTTYSVFLLVTATSGQKGPARAETAVRLHFFAVMPHADGRYDLGLRKGMDNAAADSDAAVEVLTYRPGDQYDGAWFMDLALRAKTDGIILMPQEGTDFSKAVDAARAKGIPVVTVGRDLVHHRTCFVGTNSFQAGYEAGRIIVRRVGDRARIGLIIAGETEKPDQQWNQNFTLAGLSNALKEAPGARVVAAGLSRDGILFGEETADELVGKNPGLNVIVCTSGKDTIGAAQTIIDLNRVGAVTIIGYDDDPEVLAFVRKGVVSATLVRNAEKTGYEAVRAIVAAREGKPVSDFIDTGITVVTPGNLAGTRDGSL